MRFTHDSRVHAFNNACHSWTGTLATSGMLSSPAVCRCIDKAGGLDRYLLKTPDQELASDTGEKLRSEIIAKRQLQRATQQNVLPFAASTQPVTSELL